MKSASLVHFVEDPVALMLKLHLFGWFRAEDDSDLEITIRSKKGQALLAFLALPLGKPRSREELMALLWSDRSDEQARSSLRQTLSRLRRDLGAHANALIISNEKIILDPELVLVAPRTQGEELLHGTLVRDPAFEEWLRDERLRHEGQCTDGLVEEPDENTSADVKKHRGIIGRGDQRSVRYVPSKDGTNIAYTDVGSGYPVVFAGSWMTHLEDDWESPFARHFLERLASNFHLIRYDQRGVGMSDWDNLRFSVDAVVQDMQCVIDQYDFDRCAIFGASQGTVAALGYAARFPEKVSHVILHGSYVRGRCTRGHPAAEAESNALVTLIRQGWGNKNPAYRQTMTSMFMPDATQEEATWFNEFQKRTGSADNVANIREFFDNVDVSDFLPNIVAPTLVTHCEGDSVVSVAEGKYIAARIKDAEFLALDSDNHMIFESEPDFELLIDHIKRLLPN